MPTHKNMCSGCGYNFATMETFEAHRIFDVPEDWNTRRCMRPDEMQAKGWEYSEPELTFYHDGKPYKKATPTWTKPLSEKQIESLQRLQRQN